MDPDRDQGWSWEVSPLTPFLGDPLLDSTLEGGRCTKEECTGQRVDVSTGAT